VGLKPLVFAIGPYMSKPDLDLGQGVPGSDPLKAKGVLKGSEL